MQDLMQKKWTIIQDFSYAGKCGVLKEADGIRFTLVVPEGKTASVLLYENGKPEPADEIAFPEKPVCGNIYTIKIKGLPWRQMSYNYRIDGRVIQDPYAEWVTGREKFNEAAQAEDLRCRFAFMQFNWCQDVHPQIAFADAIMYHLHVRNFTKDRRSGVKHKGTFAGLAEKIPYLKDLGINQIKLMPIYEFDELPKPQSVGHIRMEKYTGDLRLNCWGYEKALYFAPKASFASGKDPVTELKSMIMQFHEAGIEVLLDFYFEPDENPRLMLDCLEFWVKEYHVDGFHIIGNEQAGHFASMDAFFAKTKIICSGFSSTVYMQKEKEFTNCGELNDGFMVDARRLLKGDEGVMRSFADRNRRNPDTTAVINYLTNHDGFTLQDLVSYDRKHNEDNGENNEDGSSYNFSWNCGVEGDTKKKAVLTLRNQQKRNAVMMLMLSQGTPMLLAGDEFGNSQKGNNNTYCQDNEIAYVNWANLKKNREFFAFVKDMIRFRTQNKCLHQETEPQLSDTRSCGYPQLSYHSERAWYSDFTYDSRQLGMLYCGEYAQQEGFLYVVYNLHPLEQEMALPKLPEKEQWVKIIDSEAASGINEIILTRQERTCMMPPRSIAVFCSREV